MHLDQSLRSVDFAMYTYINNHGEQNVTLTFKVKVKAIVQSGNFKAIANWSIMNNASHKATIETMPSTLSSS